MKTDKPLTTKELITKIGAELEQRKQAGQLTLDTDLTELTSLTSAFVYLFDASKLQLSDVTLTVDKMIAIDATAEFYGLIGVKTHIDFELQDERILFRLTGRFPQSANIALPGLSGFAVSALQLTVETFLDDRLLRAYLEGTLHLQTTAVPIRLQFPTLSEDWILSSSIAVQLPRFSDLTALLGDELVGWTPPALEQLGAFSLCDLRMIFRPGVASVELLSARLEPVDAAAKWTLLPGLQLRKPAMELGIAHLTDATRRGAFGNIAGLLRLGSIDLQLAAGKFSAAAPWALRGSLLPGESCGLQELVKQLLPETVLPGELPDSRFSDLALEVVPQTGEFSLQGTSTGAWTIPLGFGDLQIDSAQLLIQRSAASAGQTEAGTSCKVTGAGTLRLQLTEGVAADFSGMVQFQAGQQQVGFTFTADKAASNRLRAAIPVGASGHSPAIEFSFSEIGIDHSEDGWQVQAAATTLFTDLPGFLTAPIPGTQISLVPQQARVWSFRAGRGLVEFSIDRLWEGDCPQVPLPSIQVGDNEVSLGVLWLDARQWTIRFGKQSPSAAQVTLQTTLQVAVSAEINRLFGVGADGQPRMDLFKTFRVGQGDPAASATGIQLDLSEKGISALFKGSPFNALQPDAEGFYQLSLGADGQFGRLRSRMPEFRFDGAGWTAAGEWHVEKPLQLPLTPAKAALTQAGLGLLGEVLPEAVPLEDLQLVDKQGRLSFAPWLERLAQQSQVQLPKELLKALDSLEKVAEDLLAATPGRFNNYLNFQMPTDLAFAIEVRAGGGIKLNMTTRSETGRPAVPVKLLIPFVDPSSGIPELLGVELVSLGFGEILSGSLFLLEMEGTIDRFDLISMALCLATGHLADGKTSSKVFQRSYRIDQLLAVMPAATPLPVPLFYREIGVSYYGWEMLQFESHWHFPLPEVGLFGALDLFKQLKRYFCEEGYRLPIDAPPEGFKLPFTIGPNYLRLPPYLGGKQIGSDQPLPEWSVWSSLASLLNGLKTGSPSDFLQALPVEARVGAVTVDLGPFSASAGAAVTTPSEFQSAILAGKVRTAAGKDFGERLRTLGAGPEKQLAALLPKRDGQKTAADGLIILLLGEFGIAEVVSLQASFGLAAIGSKGFGTGVRLAGSIGETLRIAIQGSLIVEPDSLKIQGGTGIWWGENLLTGIGLVTCVGAAGLSTELDLTLTPDCRVSGTWMVSKDAMVIGGGIDWDYGGSAPLSAGGSADFSAEGLRFSTTRLESAALHGIQLKKLTALLPAVSGQPLQATVELAIPAALSSALTAEVDAAAKQAKGELENARQLTMQQLNELKGYEVSVAGVRQLLIAICNGAVKAIRKSVGRLPKKKTYGSWPVKKTVKVRSEANKEVAPYIRAINGFAQTFANSPATSLATDVVALVNWALRNKTHKVKRYGFTVTTVTVFSSGTVSRLQTIKARVPGWVAHLPAQNSGLTLSGTQIDYARGSVNAALRDIADSLDKTSSNIPTLTGLSLESDLRLVPSSDVKVRMEVRRNDKTKVYAILLNFDQPAVAAKDLFKLVAKDLGTAL